MGVAYSFACESCQITQSLGYGSYLYFLGRENMTINEYDALPDKFKDFNRNIQFRELIKNHDGHKWRLVNWDFSSIDNGNLIDDHDRYLIIEGYASFREIPSPLD